MPERTTNRATRSKADSVRVARKIRGRVTSRRTPKSKSGVPITGLLADELAKEAERGYDLERGRHVGRKSLGGDAGHSPRLSIRTSHELYERALAIAFREGKTLSQVARDALEKYVKQGGPRVR